MIKKKEGMTLSKMINTTPISIEMKDMYLRNSYEEYKEFYKFLLENCRKDKKDVEIKKLKYLLDTYSDLIYNFEKKNLSDDNSKKIRMLCKKYQERLNQYIEKGKNEYNLYDSTDYENKQYKYYDNLSSWYSMKDDLLDSIVNNLYRKTLKDMENMNKTMITIDIDKNKSEIIYI